MQPTPVHVGVMDSQRPGLVVMLPVAPLSSAARMVRGLLRMALVSGIGLVVLLIPLLHACGAVVAVLAGPIAGFFAWRQAALIGAGEVACPRCTQPLAMPAKLAGWPARTHCQKCGAMVELNPAEMP